jgi:HEAT repeat protein
VLILVKLYYVEHDVDNTTARGETGMIDSKQLSQLLDLLESSEETESNSASELLENCGAPGLGDVAFLSEQLKSAQAPRVYWCSTLLGRLGSDCGGPAVRSRIQAALCQATVNESLELSARERAAWAIGELGDVDSVCRDLLKTQVKEAPARLKRLLETAIAS